MYREILINSTPNETRIAMLEDGQLVEIITERTAKMRMIGDIYKGIVTAVIPGMQAAFVDIGMEKSGFLAATEVGNLYSETDEFDEDEDEVNTHRKPIEEVLKKGQEILVQILKEPIGTKGPRLTADISLAGRFVVFMPGANHVAVSRKIGDREERKRLRNYAKQYKPENVGIIIRTVSQNVSANDVNSDIQTLNTQWLEIKKKTDTNKAPACVYKEKSVTSSVIRDLFSEQIDSLVVDSEEDFKQINSYIRQVSPKLIPRVRLYKESISIFDAFEIEKEIRRTLDRKVWLKSGGYVIIDHTEALIAIDVNTGRYTGKKKLEETILKTNLEAAREIGRQLRLRDLGGIIVIDFIDMDTQANREEVLNELRHVLKRDRSKTKVYDVSHLGLVEMTRQRKRPSIHHTYYETCPTCNGLGQILSKESLSMQVERWVKRAGISSTDRKIKILANPTIARFIIEENEERLAELQDKFKIDIFIAEDPSLGLDEFQVYSLETGEEITDEFFA